MGIIYISKNIFVIEYQYGQFSSTQAKILDIMMSLIEPHSKIGDKNNFPKFFLWRQTVISKSLPRVCHGKGRKCLGWSNKISEFYLEITNQEIETQENVIIIFSHSPLEYFAYSRLRRCLTLRNNCDYYLSVSKIYHGLLPILIGSN